MAEIGSISFPPPETGPSELGPSVVNPATGASAQLGASAAGQLGSAGAPEPAVTGTGMFSDVMDAVGTVAEAGLSGIPLGLAGEYGPLLALQLKMQQELEATTLLSNIEKTKHEAKMASIRNIRSS